jgi:WD40 repeat protein
VPALPSKSELRSVAVAALMASDARLIRETMISDFYNFIAGATSGGAGHIDISKDGSVAAAEFVDMSDWSGSQVHTSQQANEIDKSLRAPRVIDVRTGRELLSPTGKSFGHLPGCFAFNADGTLLAVGESAKMGLRIKIWKVPEFQPPARELTWSKYAASDLDAPLNRLVFSPNGRRLAYVRHGYKQIDVAVWDLETGEEKTFRDQQDRDVAWGPSTFTPDSRSLVICAGPKRMTMLDLDGQDPPSHFELPSGFQGTFAFSPPHPEVVSVGGIVWDYRNNRVVASASPYGVGGGDVAIDSQGTLLAAGGDDGVAVYRLPSAEPVLRLQRATGAMICWTADRRHLVSVAASGAIQTWEVALSDLHRVAPVEGGPVTGFAFSPDGRRLGVWNDDEARLVNVATGESERKYEYVSKLVFSADGERVAVLPSHRSADEPDLADENGAEPMVIVADVATGEELWRRPVQGSVVSAAFNRRGELLAGIDTGKGESGVWNIETNRLVCETPGGTISFTADLPVLSSDGRLVAVELESSRPLESENVVVLEVDSSTRIALLESRDDLSNLQFSPDNRFVAGSTVIVPRFNATGGTTSTTVTCHVLIWKLPEGKRHSELGPYPPFRAPVNVVFSRDGSLIAVGRRDGITEVWNVERNEQLFQIQIGAVSVWGQLSFTPDGRNLAWTSPSGPERTSSQIEYLDLSILQEELRRIRLNW